MSIEEEGSQTNQGRTTRNSKLRTLDDVGEAGGVGVEGQEKAPGLDGGAVRGHAGALELLVLLVPVLDRARLGLHLPGRLSRLKPLDPPLPLLRVAPTLPGLFGCQTDPREEEKAEGCGGKQGDPAGGRHGRRSLGMRRSRRIPGVL